ncbi:MAG: alpha/beta fold hydrolase [Dactylosporangium sp.]|nr:alpha/beta fold hydrolase [Dactylosporangium sp.]NNJ61022.1 alpha/beta fold hydrolase [Dactylosporangium sp.]
MTANYTSAAGAAAVAERYRELLDRWPVPSEHLRLPTGEGETFVVASGPRDAPAVVLLHGSGSTTAMWMGDIEAWSERFRVYAVDLVGEPGRSAPSRPALASDAFARWLDDVLDGLGVARASIVGVSLGGWLALDYAIRRPERVDRLALLCPGGVGRQRWGILALALLVMPFGDWGRRRALRLILGPAPPVTTPEAQAFVDYMMLISEHFKPRRETLPRFGDDELRRLSMPMLVVVGGRDGLLNSRETRRRLAKLTPHATVRLLPEAGHLVLGQTQPILDFLRAAGPGDRSTGDQ